MLKELYPDEPSGTGQVVIPDDGLPSKITSGQRRQKKERQRWILAGAGGLVVLGLALALPALRQPAAPPVITVVSPPPPAPRPALPVNVSVRVNSAPAGADVVLAGEATPRGQTPLTLTLPRSGASAQLLVRAKGYQENALAVTLDSDSRLEVTLTPLPVVPPPSRPARAPAHKVVEKPKPKVGPDLRKGDVVDPFAQ
jgi:hypothetical protein